MSSLTDRFPHLLNVQFQFSFHYLCAFIEYIVVDQPFSALQGCKCGLGLAETIRPGLIFVSDPIYHGCFELDKVLRLVAEVAVHDQPSEV